MKWSLICWFLCLGLGAFAQNNGYPPLKSAQGLEASVVKTLRKSILLQANQALKEAPLTVTADLCPRSAGGKHDFYSEGDYWWPDPNNPDGPYIQKDGLSNPDNFVAHRQAMIRLSQVIGSLASAYVLTGREKYVTHAFKHLRAWFVDTSTMMTPSLLYAQAIKGRFTGRGIGVIDAIHLIEVSQGIMAMETAKSVDPQELTSIKNWFASFIQWLTTHQYGLDEMNAQNNHGTCWVMQVAAFAKLTGDQKWMDFCKDRYKQVLLPRQMDPNGSFPREINRTKPYGYSLFNLDAMVMICQILSSPADNLWTYQTEDGKNIRLGLEFLVPYVQDKNQWFYQKDVMYWDNWPVAHPFLVFGALAFERQEWLALWQRLDHEPKVPEVLRNLPVRNPVIWLQK